ncbi:hypothetical protein BM221_008330 [Beauveria bassiana]|uniref:Uncharacterized protein n=1 Tax=Beauveria bassiana TaxID=176275 RepID=A0A2N6NFT5_BEABA|nr:hypothetical protein BM221_008330 [Beauveria bassiana]
MDNPQPSSEFGVMQGASEPEALTPDRVQFNDYMVVGSVRACTAMNTNDSGAVVVEKERCFLQAFANGGGVGANIYAQIHDGHRPAWSEPRLVLRQGIKWRR